MKKNHYVLAALLIFAAGLPAAIFGTPSACVLIDCEGRVEFSRQGGAWQPAAGGAGLDFGDRVRTGEYSRAAVRLPNESLLRIDELSTVKLEPPKGAERANVGLEKGALYFFSRSKKAELDLATPTANGAIRGTEFEVHLEDGGATVMSLFEGAVDLSNAAGTVSLTGGEQGTARPGAPPEKTVMVEAANIIQWALYYPGVLDADEIPFSGQERSVLAASLSAYRKGNLKQALAQYPEDRKNPGSAAVRIYRAGLLLTVGQVDEAQALCAQAGGAAAFAGAVREVIAAVKGQTDKTGPEPKTASQWLARSYLLQAKGELPRALAAAKKAAEMSSRFGFARARLGELLFSFGSGGEALDALDGSLELAPENPQALALKGFILAGENNFGEAAGAFGSALDLDAALGNAWLGRGLTAIRQNRLDEGREDLQAAAIHEPNRAFLRSYLAKANADAEDYTAAEKELGVAIRLDPEDPTPYLYSAILNQRRHRYNDAIRDLEKSIELNDNRRVYRSKFLLDQDSAVRKANLAAIYKNAGMTAISVREASQAVEDDFTNYSAHLFLANSFEALRDPSRFHLRWETAWTNELLLANLFAPASAGTLSPNVSLREYSALFERTGFGLNAQTTYLTHGNFRQVLSHYGLLGGTSYTLDFDFHDSDGFRDNEDFQRWAAVAQVKRQITPADTAFLRLEYYDKKTGDLFAYHDPDDASRAFEFEEDQTPSLLGGWRHNWGPGNDTLLLAGHLQDDSGQSDRGVLPEYHILDGGGNIISSGPFNGAWAMDYTHKNELDINTGEICQVFQGDIFSLILGTRHQEGSFEAENGYVLQDPAYNSLFAEGAPPSLAVREDFRRDNLYGYAYWSPFEPVTFTAGLAWDKIKYPRNLWTLPVLDGSKHDEHISPKAGVTWRVLPGITLRGMYANTVGGVTFDESIRLEPTQVAGFTQGFRTLIAESIEGAVSAPEFDIGGAAFTWKLASNTYLDIKGVLRDAGIKRETGTFHSGIIFNPVTGNFEVGNMAPAAQAEELEYEERELTVSVNRLIGADWALGGEYQMIDARLERRFPGLPDFAAGAPETVQEEDSTLRTARLFAIYNHPRGFFGKIEANWYWQDNDGFGPAAGGEEFGQYNLYAGYRSSGPRWRWEASAGVVNIGGEDYRMRPLSPHAEPPRETCAVFQFKINM